MDGDTKAPPASAESVVTSRPWWVTALVASLVSMVLFALALYLPPSRATVVMVGGAVVFVVVILKNPAFWRRRLAGACVGVALACLVAPKVQGFLDLGSLGLLLFDGGVSVVLILLLLVVGVVFAALETHAERPPSGPREVVNNTGVKTVNHFHGPVNFGAHAPLVEHRPAAAPPVGASDLSVPPAAALASGGESSSPRVFISWSHEPDPETEVARTHRARVLALTDQLRAGGVDAQLDLYDPHPPEGWPAWMSSGIENADFILIVCSATYLRRWKGEVVDGKGLGVRWEGHLVRNLLHRELARQARVVPVLFESASPSDIPLEVAGASMRRLPAEYPDLYRHLTNQPATSKPRLGPIRRDVENIDAPAHAITGREEELARIDAGLAHGGAAALVQAISGLGGVGKTRIALEYAHTRAVHYEVRWWTYAHRLDSDLADLARALGVADPSDDVDRAAKAARDYLRTHSRWLLVIDNADDPELLRIFLPKIGRGHVLITSRATAWHGTATPIEIRVLPPDAARQLLLDRSRQSDDGHAAELARVLGYLPLALVQAAAYLENSRETFANYLDILRSGGLGLFDDRLSDPHDPLLSDPADAHRRTVARTWRPNIDAVRNDPDDGHAAVALLDFLAFLDPDGFPIALLSEKPDLLPEPLLPLAASPRRRNGAVALLLGYSLVDRDQDPVRGDRIRVHRLVQQVTREALPSDRRQALAAEVIAWARAVFAYDPQEARVGTVPIGIAAQLVALGERAECVAVAGSQLSWVLGDLSGFLIGRGDVAAALRAGRQALKVAEDLAKADPHSAQAQRDLSVSLDRLGDVEVQAGNLARARDLFARSLSQREDLAKADPHSAQAQRDLSVSWNKLGDIEVQAGSLARARDLFARSLSQREDLAKADPHSAQAQRDLSVSLERLGDVEVQAGNMARARDLFARSLKVAEYLAKADPHSAQAQSDLSVSLDRLGDVEVQAGNLARARDLFARSLSQREDLAKADPHSAQAQSDLSVSLDRLGDVEVQAG
ncbi:MAG TPA: TIR domain-containing protein, partial [Nannocystaceae bacterium]|nr:TIR domain-containing protein [Nannocystaceae bacterium]